ncbi:hypothetical protein CASFOL_010330 [Castilleja foliolosa]|uniref:Light-harvesting complex-like protein 3 isotype 1, chloroplastic n=1 Tax=Castilleja foliolosa TaxID=1961234 RepID=A0ABD3DS86_9LAMI
MASSIGISASIQRAHSCYSQHITHKPSTQSRSTRSSRATNVVTPNVEGLKLTEKQELSPLVPNDNPEHGFQNSEKPDKKPSSPRFNEARWKNGTWDLNMFVKQEAKRRKFLELHPETSSNDEPVVFRSSIIPLWAWIVRSHLPEAELLNGRAAMVGFFMAYLVDALTGVGVVGQTGNFICKGALLFTIIGVLVFRRTEDVDYIRKLVDEATFYDKQWRASWQDADEGQVRKND